MSETDVSEFFADKFGYLGCAEGGLGSQGPVLLALEVHSGEGLDFYCVFTVFGCAVLVFQAQVDLLDVFQG